MILLYRLKNDFMKIVAILFFTVASASAGEIENTISALIAENSAPPGIVFEVVSRDKKLLDWAIPKIKESAKRLRNKYPQVGIAVVTHGNEQFALTSNNHEKHKNTHQQVKSLLDENVTVHVCGTNAKNHGVTEQDFPDYIDVSPSGPAQINDYKNLGYILIKITRAELENTPH